MVLPNQITAWPIPYSMIPKNGPTPNQITKVVIKITNVGRKIISIIFGIQVLIHLSKK
jgi:hypothetical protein